jgi:DNA-directed RNA polymerase specialized sigma24 family protein
LTKEEVKFIQREVMKYTGCYQLNQILYSYDRLTVEELAQDVILRLLRSPVETMNKTYIRKAIMFHCIERYRKISDYDEVPLEHLEDPQDAFEFQERLMTLKIFDPRELLIIGKLMEGYKNSEIRKDLGIPKMTYYATLKRIRKKYVDNDI